MFETSLISFIKLSELIGVLISCDINIGTIMVGTTARILRLCVRFG